ncbi:MAG: D-glycero-alpha-D-manno-heptose-1,7-bisphosphate 7-phosphatase [Chloroflexota bacterium]
MKPLPTSSSAIFLDRDGVIIENRAGYVRGWEDVEFFPAAIQALAGLAASPYRIVLVTNQSAVGRGILSLAAAQAINRQLVIELERNGCRIDGVFMCPHGPEMNCTCRKPRPGLLLQAAEALSIDLASSIMIGDAWTDLQAGQAAGVDRTALLRTGRGKQQLSLPPPAGLKSWAVYDDLAEALAHLFAAPDG